MNAGLPFVLALIACCLAAIAGFCLWRVYDEFAQTQKRRDALLADHAHTQHVVRAAYRSDEAQGANGIQMWAITYAKRISHGMKLGRNRMLLRQPSQVSQRFARIIALAGLQDDITYGAYRECCVRLGLAGCLIGALIGSCISYELSGGR